MNILWSVHGETFFYSTSSREDTEKGEKERPREREGERELEK